MVLRAIKILVSVSHIFPNVGSDLGTFKALLSTLSRTKALYWCSYINLVISEPELDYVTKQEFILNQFLAAEEIELLNDFVSENGGAENVAVFSRGQILELIRWILLYCSDLPEVELNSDDHAARRRFVQTALISNDIWGNRIFENRFSLDGGVSIARQRALGAIRKNLEGTSTTPYVYKALGRGYILFKDYLPRFYQSFESEFYIETDLSIDEYFICIGTIMVHFMNPKIGLGIFDPSTWSEETPYAGILQKYIDLEAQTEDELTHALWGNIKDVPDYKDAPDYNYLPLREKPILCTPDGRAFILDSIFYSEKVSIGPLFLLPQAIRSQAFTDFGRAFEAFTCDILKRMFPDISTVVNRRLVCNVKGTNQAGQDIEIDACLNDLTEIVLFEIKTGLIREDKILADNYKDYLEHLRDKYVWNRKNNKPVGIGQLARTIDNLASKKWLGENQEFANAKLIYPVMIVHDTLFSIPVYGHFFASEFKNLLDPDVELQTGELMKGELRVAPLIMMAINDLENLENSIKHFGFRDLLADYTRSHSDRLTPLHNFIASSPYAQNMYHNQFLVDTGLKILDKIKEAVYPTVDNELI